MEMEVMMPSLVADFNFDGTCSSPFMTAPSSPPFISAPSSPPRFGNLFFSAPASPTRISAFYGQFSSFNGGDAATGSGALSPISFEEGDKAGDYGDNTDFAFDFSGQLEVTSLTAADELFDGGKIKPLLEYSEIRTGGSPKSPRSPKKLFKKTLSPRNKNKQFDSMAAAIEQAHRESNQEQSNADRRRRGRTHDSSNSIVRRKGPRSLSPLRVSEMRIESDNNQLTATNSSSSSSSMSSSSSSGSNSLINWYRNFNLKDLLLFRSSSEGTNRSLKKYTLLKKSHRREDDDVKNASFRSIDSVGSASSSRRRAPVSAHELHYTANRAAAEEMRKRTFLPYRRGLLGCLRFDAAVHEISRRHGSSMTTR